MNNKGFTLIELLVVIVIVAVVSVGATVSFGNIDDDTSQKELVNTYKGIERGGSLYLDLHQEALAQLISDKEVTIKINALQDENYVSRDLVNPINGESIDGSYSVVMYITTNDEGKEYVDTCIADYKSNGSKVCIADGEGHKIKKKNASGQTVCMCCAQEMLCN